MGGGLLLVIIIAIVLYCYCKKTNEGFECHKYGNRTGEQNAPCNTCGFLGWGGSNCNSPYTCVFHTNSYDATDVGRCG